MKCDLKCSHSNELKATEQYFLVLLFIMMYNLVLTLKWLVLFIMLYKVVLMCSPFPCNVSFYNIFQN